MPNGKFGWSADDFEVTPPAPKPDETAAQIRQEIEAIEAKLAEAGEDEEEEDE